ncbi:MAG TPA: HEAT repeat domain-containing protein [Myxococcales bacterium]|jgi:hypothetical protein
MSESPGFASGLFLGLVGFFLVALARAARIESARMADARTIAWRCLGRGLGLEFVPSREPGLAGTVDGFGVFVDRVVESSSESSFTYTRIVVDSHGRVPCEVALAKRRPSWPAEPGEGFRERFDAHVCVTGPEDMVLAMLSFDVRCAVASFVAGAEGELRQGTLTGRWLGEPTEVGLGRKLDTLLALARSLVAPSIPPALLRNVVSDPDPVRRQRSLQALSSPPRSQSPEARQAFVHALTDSDPDVRFLAAQGLAPSEESRGVLASLARDSDAREELRAAAFDRLPLQCPYASFADLAVHLLSADGVVVQRAAVRAVGYARDPSALDALAALSGTQDERLGATLAWALAEIGGAKAEKVLVSLLAARSTRVRCEAAAGLFRVGSIDAVQPLLPLARGLFVNGSLKSAARDAVQAIQARLEGAPSGSLSLSDGPAEFRGLSLVPPAPLCEGPR